MLKFVKGYVENIDGVAVYPMISLVIFFVFFVVLFFWVFTTKKERIEELSKMPLDNQN
tara:strand:+ start:207 stop:380 length:174 start_codon:yes stop_codon:yes gene_type:complete